MVLPFGVPVVVFPPPRLITSDVPDCEIDTGEFETEERKSAQGAAEVCAPALIFQAPSTENGAFRLRPLRSTPTSPTSGSPTRRMYAITKLRFECDIAFSNPS